MTEQTEGCHIESVSVEILSMLIRKHDDVTVFYYDDSIRQERMLLEELEHVDHILEAEGITLVSVNDPVAAEKFSVDVIPAIVHYQFKQPHYYTGDLTNEKKIVQWVLKIREEA